jgi:hypothetical protein
MYASRRPRNASASAGSSTVMGDMSIFPISSSRCVLTLGMIFDSKTGTMISANRADSWLNRSAYEALPKGWALIVVKNLH